LKFLNKIPEQAPSSRQAPGLLVRSAIAFCGLLLLGLSGSVSAEENQTPLKVAVSIKPLHSLIAGVMDGSGNQPSLIISSGASPHDYSLKPSDARKIANAHLIFWAGAGLERFLEKPLHSLASKAIIVPFVTGDETIDEKDHQHGHDHHGPDPHIWLSPQQAQTIVATATRHLAKIDPGNAARYHRNAETLGKRLQDFHIEAKALLAPVASKPFLVFHDAYGHLAKAFDLNIAGIVTISPERAPGAGQVSDLRKLMRSRQAICLFGEPQVDTNRLNMIVENIEGARTGTLDPLGSDIRAGKDMYFTLMRSNISALVKCLAAD